MLFVSCLLLGQKWSFMLKWASDHNMFVEEALWRRKPFFGWTRQSQQRCFLFVLEFTSRGQQTLLLDKNLYRIWVFIASNLMNGSWEAIKFNLGAIKPSINVTLNSAKPHLTCFALFSLSLCSYEIIWEKKDDSCVALYLFCWGKFLLPTPYNRVGIHLSRDMSFNLKK